MLTKRTLRLGSLLSLVGLLSFSTSSCSDDDNDDQQNPPSGVEMSTFNYAFNNGELGAGTAYNGIHNDALNAELMVKSDGENAELTITLTNTQDGEMYMIHAHDAADPNTTPNGTPYNETPNGDILATSLEGNGGTASVTVTTNGFSYDDLVNDYAGFFVIHDPTQPISTVDISTYLVVGSFAREQGTPANYREESFSYAFNTGQVDPNFAYSGMHQNNLSATLTVKELANNNTRISVELENTLSGETYMVHSHDMADPANTPNGTPYDETPNSDVMSQMAMGNGGTARVSQTSSQSFDDITNNYDAFFVVHYPLQAISTVDPTTYVILGVFAR
jgi:hypothetical protein